MLFGTLGGSLLGDLLTGRGAIANRQGQGIYRTGKDKGNGVLRDGYGRPSSSVLQNKMDF